MIVPSKYLFPCSPLYATLSTQRDRLLTHAYAAKLLEHLHPKTIFNTFKKIRTL